MEPVIEDQKHNARISAIIMGSLEAAKMNKIASIWTACSVVLGTISGSVAKICRDGNIGDGHGRGETARGVGASRGA